jgi:ParB family transcriptional regulator, chromosome partitioning protein
MSARRTGLGRGLEALLGEDTPRPRLAEAQRDGLRSIPVELLVRGAYQPRQDMDQQALEELAQSIRSQGLVQPIVVRPLPGALPGEETRYEIIAGERRWRAAQLAGLATIPAVVREIPIQRLLVEFKLTHQDAAEAIGRSRAAVTNLLRLLELGEPARALLRAKSLEMGHARALLALADGRMQAEVAALVAKKQLSVRETERLVRRVLEGGTAGGKPAEKRQDADIRRLQDELSERLGARVSIAHGSKGRGKLVVEYNSVDELEGIIAHIQ